MVQADLNSTHIFYLAISYLPQSTSHRKLTNPTYLTYLKLFILLTQLTDQTDMTHLIPLHPHPSPLTLNLLPFHSFILLYFTHSPIDELTH